MENNMLSGSIYCGDTILGKNGAITTRKLVLSSGLTENFQPQTPSGYIMAGTGLTNGKGGGIELYSSGNFYLRVPAANQYGIYARFA